MQSSKEFVLLLTTESDFVKARALAKNLLEKKIAACVNFNEIESHYWWKGEINISKEIQLIIKTTKDKEQENFQVINQIHSYDIPEIVSIPFLTSDSYSKWMLSIVS